MRTIPLGLTFDDVLLIPQESTLHPSDIHIGTRLTKRLTIRAPILGGAMDTVTEAPMATALADDGAIGILHRNCTIADQVRMVKKVKIKKLRLVGASISPHDLQRAKALDRAGADVLVVDCAHAHKPSIIADAKKIKTSIRADLVVGNIATAAAARALIPFADAIKVGVGPGSICTTRVVAGIGVPQLTAIMNVAAVAKRAKVPVIADGGIRYSGDVVKALAAGASSVMLGSLFAGTKETPGIIITIKGKQYKRYRGMGSFPVMMEGKSSDRYASPSGGSLTGGQKKAKKYVPEGVEAITPYKGPVADVLFQLVGGIRTGMGYVGAKDIPALHKKAQFMQMTPAGRAESHPHSITIEKKAPNY